jgi:hypothetical protein
MVILRENVVNNTIFLRSELNEYFFFFLTYQHKRGEGDSN